MSVIVTAAATAAKESTPKGDTIVVKLNDSVHVPVPDVKHGIAVYHADDVIEVPAAYGERFVRIGHAEKVK